jgi:hypothetical protein
LAPNGRNFGSWFRLCFLADLLSSISAPITYGTTDVDSAIFINEILFWHFVVFIIFPHRSGAEYLGINRLALHIFVIRLKKTRSGLQLYYVFVMLSASLG